MPATQGQRSKDVSFAMGAIKAALRAVQLVLDKFPDLFRDQPIPAEANLPHLLLKADLQTSPNRIGHSHRARQQLHHAEESFVEEVDSRLESLLGVTRQFEQKNKGEPPPLPSRKTQGGSCDEIKPLHSMKNGGFHATNPQNHIARSVRNVPAKGTLPLRHELSAAFICPERQHYQDRLHTVDAKLQLKRLEPNGDFQRCPLP
jgi:hypothetical protein